MTIRKESINGGLTHYYTVNFGPREFVTDSGKIVPYGFAVGTIREEAGKIKINMWRPAAMGVPRDYKAAAMRALNEAALKQFGRTA